MNDAAQRVTNAHRAALAVLAEEPNTIDDLVDHLSNGGTVTSWAALHKTAPLLVFRWVHSDPARLAAYQGALEAQLEAWREGLRHDVQRLARSYVVGELTLAQVEELREAGQAPLILKPADKLRGIELAGRDLGMFKERVAVDVTHTVADKLKAARARVHARVLEHAPAGVLDLPIRLDGGGGGDSTGGPPHPPLLAQKISESKITEDRPAPAREAVVEGAAAGDPEGLL